MAHDRGGGAVLEIAHVRGGPFLVGTSRRRTVRSEAATVRFAVRHVRPTKRPPLRDLLATVHRSKQQTGKLLVRGAVTRLALPIRSRGRCAAGCWRLRCWRRARPR